MVSDIIPLSHDVKPSAGTITKAGTGTSETVLAGLLEHGLDEKTKRSLAHLAAQNAVLGGVQDLGASAMVVPDTARGIPNIHPVATEALRDPALQHKLGVNPELTGVKSLGDGLELIPAKPARALEAPPAQVIEAGEIAGSSVTVANVGRKAIQQTEKLDLQAIEQLGKSAGRAI